MCYAKFITDRIYATRSEAVKSKTGSKYENNK